MLQKIINADDFGISPGVNKAIITAFKEGVLNSASLMVNVAYTDEAVRLIKENPGLKVGIHLNLTKQKNQKPVATPADIPLLVDENGLLKHGGSGLGLLSLFKLREFQRQAEIEMRTQIEKVKALGISVAHLDSHRHVHMLPALFPVVKKLQEEYKISRLRVINESFWKTLPATKNWKCFIDGGVIKHCLMKVFYILNRTKSDTYFYSLIHTTRLFGQNMKKIKVPAKFKAIEIGIHPSIIAEDKKVGSEAFADYLLYSDDRQKEFEALLDKSLVDRITFS